VDVGGAAEQAEDEALAMEDPTSFATAFAEAIAASGLEADDSPITTPDAGFDAEDAKWEKYPLGQLPDENDPDVPLDTMAGLRSLGGTLADLFCKRLRVYRKLATRADHRTNPSATYIGLGLNRRPSSTNLATTLELLPAMPAKPGGSGPTGAKDIKVRHHDDDQQCL
jgi:hypothetical protein